MWWSPLKNSLIALLAITFLAMIVSCKYTIITSSSKTTSPKEEISILDLSYLNEMSFLEVASEYFVEAKAALRRGDSAVALKYLQTAFMLDTNSKFLYNKVIEVSIASGNPASAITAIKRGRDYSEMSDEDLRKIASIYINYRSYVQAFQTIEAVKEKTMKDTLFLMRLSMAENLAMVGALYNSQGKHDSALIALNKVVEMGIKTPNILFELGMANERLGNFEVAEKYFKEILLDKPRNSMFALAANYLAYMWAERNINIIEAEELILLALAEEPNNGAFLDTYGWVLFRLGRFQEALKQFLLAAEQVKDDYVMYYHLAETYLELGDKKKALENFKKANEFVDNPDFEKIKEIISDLSE